MSQPKFRLWDLPTRLFHWSLAAAIVAASLSGQLGGGLMTWHGRIGLAVVGLLAFRLVWGVVGSTYARFAHFIPTPARIRAYLKGEWHGEGHNPLGALSVFGLLGLLTVQVATGLFANDDIAFTGPLYDLAGKALSNRLTAIHHLLSKLVYLLVALHVGAIVFYARIKKQNLVLPMLTGVKEGAGEPARGGGIVALAVALVMAAAMIYGASGRWMPPPPPPPPAASTPDF
ncbi:cytochrome B [Magnetospirillum sp. ME-1]|uniref:cytochrome b/b6 domain-containing protein n=1 Tax=Magnetospirillum sp. ME-1 TaxID=1639348 RepID=UPI000A17C4D4|nr:cytochrome b/b6 domain-containing protein [Magnetospirillum sp. ME-1]ARJ64461.1 cytochrome B [Magnetospirillum sp. ME-1]